MSECVRVCARGMAEHRENITYTALIKNKRQSPIHAAAAAADQDEGGVVETLLAAQQVNRPWQGNKAVGTSLAGKEGVLKEELDT